MVLVYSMNVSLDGFVADRDGDHGWGAGSDELFRFHLEQLRGLDGYLLGRRLYETMLVWETDPSLQTDEERVAFADVWRALPKVVFSRTLDEVEGNARLAEGSIAEEVAAADGEVSIGGPELAAQAIGLGLIDDLRMLRHPVLLGGGKPFLPPVEDRVAFELVETRTFAPGVVFERYGRV
jgi:dihydrofolate reductase